MRRLEVVVSRAQGLAGAGTSIDAVFEYDPATDGWRTRAALPAPRGAMGVAVIDGRIYAAGGLRGGISVADFAVYDRVGDAWTSLPAVPTGAGGSRTVIRTVTYVA